MKRLVILSIFLVSALISVAQTDSTYVEQYYQVIATPKLLSNKVTIDIDYGEEKSFWLDSRLKTDAGRLRKFNTIIDALNYIGKEGWVFINAYPVRLAETVIYHFGFKKLFLKSEIQ